MRILIVEDSPTQAAELCATLAEAGFTTSSAGSLAEATAVLADRQPEVILLDLGLPDANGLEVFRQMRAAGPDIPIVVLTGLEDENAALAAVQEGAQDYLFKGGTDQHLLLRAIRYAVERKRSESALRRSHDDLLALLNQLRTGTIMTDPSGRVTFANKACEPFIERPGTATVGRHWQEVLPLEAADASRLLDMTSAPAAERGKLAAFLETPTGRRYWVDLEVHDDPRDPERKIFFLYDMSAVRDLQRLLDGRAGFRDLVGKSTSMLRVYELIRQLAAVDTTVLIEGETGTGKELVARAIHSLSPRQNKPFIAVNSAGLTDSLLASQLFGHRRGAFTGAVADHKGFFETASGGTLLLDEIGDIPPNVQASLLRVLQEREIVRVGESVPRKVDVRVLVATNRNLSAEVAAGTFRADLFYRIRVAHIRLPPLRERREDIPLLVESFLQQLRATTGKDVRGVTDAAIARMMEFPWPGNVRELRSVIEFAVIRSSGPLIDVGDLPPEISGRPQPPPKRPKPRPVPRDGMDQKQAEEYRRVIEALKQANGSRTLAARLLGIGRATFYRRLEMFGIDPARALEE